MKLIDKTNHILPKLVLVSIFIFSLSSIDAQERAHSLGLIPVDSNRREQNLEQTTPGRDLVKDMAISTESENADPVSEQDRSESGRWSDDIWVYSTPNHEKNPSMAYEYNNDNRVFIAIERWQGVSQPKDIVIRRSTTHGETWAYDSINEYTVTGHTSYPLFEPKIVQANSSHIGMIYIQEFGMNDRDIIYRRFDVNNLTSTSATTLNSAIGHFLKSPSITSDYIPFPDEPFVYATWINATSDTPSLMFKRSIDGGNTWNSAETVIAYINSDLNTPRYHTSIDCHGSNIAIAYVDLVGDNTKVKVIVSTTAGSTWNEPIILNSTNDLVFKPEIRFVTPNNIIVAYTQLYDDTSRKLCYNYSLDGGSTFNQWNTIIISTSIIDAVSISSYKTVTSGSDVYICYRISSDLYVCKANDLYYSGWSVEYFLNDDIELLLGGITTTIVKPAPDDSFLDIGCAVAWTVYYPDPPNDLCVLYDAEWRGYEPDPLSYPFYEDWSSADFGDQYWTVEDNWELNPVFGLPGPGAYFDYSPSYTNYSKSITSWDIDGRVVTEVVAAFDLYFSSYNQTTLEQLSFEVYDGLSWHTIAIFDNQGTEYSGSIPWTTFSYYIGDVVYDRIFKIRFRAHGVNSFNINHWCIDNIEIKPYPFEMPFIEDWSTFSFRTKSWYKDVINWKIDVIYGNPVPAGAFTRTPVQENYSYSLESPEIDATGVYNIPAQFDLYLQNNSTDTFEGLSFEVYNGSTWNTIDTFNNQGGSIPWSTNNYDISSYTSNRIFKVRFRAHGENSSNINRWDIDNIVIGSIPVILVDPSAISETVNFPTDVTVPLTVSNTGQGTLNYMIFVAGQGEDIGYRVPYTSIPRPEGRVIDHQAVDLAINDEQPVEEIPEFSAEFLNREVSSRNRSKIRVPDQEEFSRDTLDLLYYFPVYDAGGEYGVVTDGNYIYTSRWNADTFFRYNCDGTYVGSFTIPGFDGNARDMTYDGQHFYVTALSNVIYQLDLANEILLGSITTSISNIRHIAYDADNDAFWVAQPTPSLIYLVDRAGNILNFTQTTIPYISGIGWENRTIGGPCIWLYGSDNNLIQIDISTETVIQDFNLESLGIFAPLSSSGGMDITNQLIPGKWVIIGTYQNDIIWVLELADSYPWLAVNPISGSLPAGQSNIIEVTLDSSHQLQGTNNAEIIIAHNTLGENVVIPVEMTTISPDPLEFPFLENWDAGSFLDNYWLAESNWMISTDMGNPSPTALFLYDPPYYNYSFNLMSWTIDALGVENIAAQFDYRLSNYSLSTFEELSFEVFNGTDWITIETFNNQGGDIPWTTAVYDISSYASNRQFKIRFRAHGEYNWNIDWWLIDNIMVNQSGISELEVPIVSIDITGGSVILSWEAVTGANSYKIYAIEDSYSADWGAPVAITGETAQSMVITSERRFFKVIASTDVIRDEIGPAVLTSPELHGEDK